MTPTSEQTAILDAARDRDNLMCNSYAGTGKTTTLELIERAVREKPILYLCFNRSIAKEAEGRMLSTTTVRTFNGIGHRIWAQTIKPKSPILNKKKSNDILRTIIDEVPRRDQGAMWDSFWAVIEGVSLAKALGYVPEGKFPHARRLCTQSALHSYLDESPDDLTSDLIDAVLTRSIAAAFTGNIDFNDQVYMPALFGGIFPQFPLVLVDEAQDLNPTNHALLDRLVKHRVIFVGDPYQSIYGFRGAVQGGMAALAAKFKTQAHTLSISFRCPQAIVENARWRVPEFKWIKEGGHVENLKELRGADIPDNGVVLCRNNAPLFGLALKLLSLGRSVSVSGSDIGPKLIAMMRKLGPEDMTKAQTLGAILDWKTEKLEKGSTSAEDLAACMKVFADHGADLAQAIRYAEHVLAQRGTIRLMTGHKAKGLEFDTVYHLDPFLCREDEQDQNLRYVIQTRSMDRYFEIDSARIKWA